ncbi:MAG TPA: glycosyltransferase family 4 protein [Candidatus Dormibacteraeota bacterium]
MRLAFVTPRYGPEILGGAETQVRDYAERLAAAGHQVEVITSCAVDHHTWADALPAGDSSVAGVRVRRHRVSRPRDHALAARQQPVLDAGLSLGEGGERAWVENTGFSEPMLEAIAATAPRVDALLFAPYLFASTVLGAAVRPDRSLIIPCLHDEAYARFAPVQATLRGAAGLIFNTEAERDLAARLLGGLPPNRVVGEGFEACPGVDGAGFRRRHRIEGDALAYAGRRERGKNYHLVLEYVTLYGRALSRRGPVTLLSMGGGPLQPPAAAGSLVHDLGFVAHGEMLDALAASLASVQLSRMESFSRVLMEGWLSGTPAIVDAGCAVTREHCAESGGGVWVSSAEEFAAVVDRLRGDPGLRAALAGAGRGYVTRRYSWPAVLGRLEAAVRELAG